MHINKNIYQEQSLKPKFIPYYQYTQQNILERTIYELYGNIILHTNKNKVKTKKTIFFVGIEKLNDRNLLTKVRKKNTLNSLVIEIKKIRRKI